MKFEKIRQFTSEIHDEILDALEHLIDNMGEGTTFNNETQWRVRTKDSSVSVRLNVINNDDDEEMSMQLFTSIDGLITEITGCTFNLDDEGAMRITDGVYAGEDFDYETLNNEYKIVEAIDEVCNICKEINEKVENQESIVYS